MVLLENFGAESLNVELRRHNGNYSEGLLLKKVASPVTTGIPKFGKRAILKGPRTNEDQMIYTFFYENGIPIPDSSSFISWYNWRYSGEGLPVLGSKQS